MPDWPTYNQNLVRRGQVLVDFDVVDRWDHELSQMTLDSTMIAQAYYLQNTIPNLLLIQKT